MPGRQRYETDPGAGEHRFLGECGGIDHGGMMSGRWHRGKGIDWAGSAAPQTATASPSARRSRDSAEEALPFPCV
ncbi:hypothetical protein Stube_11050 [Streptomyces tubercidicus]|uniref:Uncharacterized protein n=1 Tax=Streptomyces tubercidicus TaxID=47759 RepID=A0A640UM94_9ACTN|nr:hypothetical protein Stube_11050 [Streptomyces tubercidicus]